jgi:hypothetical protein
MTKEAKSMKLFVKPDPTDLRKFATPHYSQSGEDGLLEFILDRLPITNKWCVEFGAWDGVHLSNTYHLICSAGYSAVLIEGDREKFDGLRGNIAGYPNVLAIHNFVEVDGPKSLDNILLQTPIPKDFDVLSIDIDGDDYHVWKSLRNYFPKVVVIEIKQTDKPGVMRINEMKSETSWAKSGTSLSSMTALANDKGYKLLAAFAFNAFYIESELYELFFDRDYSIESIFPYDMLPVKSLTWPEKLRHWELLLRYRSKSQLFQGLKTKLGLDRHCTKPC